MDLQFVMCFAVATPRPVPYLAAEITMTADGRLVGVPAGAEQMVLPIGAASTYYGIPAEQLREEWIVAALKDEHMDGCHVHWWNVSYDEWLDVLKRHPEIKPEALRHIFPEKFPAPHNMHDVQEPLRREYLARLGPDAKPIPIEERQAMWDAAWNNCTLLLPVK